MVIYMNKLLIYKYIERIKKEDIANYSLSQNINLNNDELNIIYDYIKHKTNEILNNPQEIINEIKDKVSISVYNKIIELYEKYKDYIN